VGTGDLDCVYHFALPEMQQATVGACVILVICPLIWQYDQHLYTHSHISELETGKRRPSLDLALRLARLFDVSLDQLVKDELELD
jgi:transcriptional regulator with XRE-family HTH domain